MAKVASTSIHVSIKSQSNLTSYHVHSLDKETISEARQKAKQKGIILDSRQIGNLIYQYRVQVKKPLKVITCVRDPLSRNLSAFFEAFKYHTGTTSSNWNGSLKALQKIYQSQFDHTYPLTWFDREIHGILGLDVYSLQFDPQQGWATYKSENIELLILRTDIDDRIKSTVIGKFIELDNFELKRENEGTSKTYSNLYTRFKSSVTFDQEYLNLLYHSKYAQHFFTQDEIQRNILSTLNHKQ